MKTLLKNFLYLFSLFFLLLPADLASAITLKNPLAKFANAEAFLAGVPEMLIKIAAIVFLAVFLIGGIQYMMSFGNEEASTKAKTTLTWGVVGLIIIAIAEAFILFLQSQLPALFMK